MRLTPEVLEEENLPSTTKRILKGRKPIPIDELSRELKLLEADSGYELSREYLEVQDISSVSNATCTVAELPDNRPKNRYCDILPCTKRFIFHRGNLNYILLNFR